MQLPSYKKKRRIKLKVCHFEGCGREFWGHPIAKYCPEHSDIKERLKKKKELEARERQDEHQEDENNQFFKHDYEEPTVVEFTCALEGCNNKFKVTLFPKQYIYPKYCEEHRNPYRRKLFLEELKKRKDAQNNK